MYLLDIGMGLYMLPVIVNGSGLAGGNLRSDKPSSQAESLPHRVVGIRVEA